MDGGRLDDRARSVARRVARPRLPGGVAATAARLARHGAWGAVILTWALVLLADLFTRTDLALSIGYVAPIALTLWLPLGARPGRATLITLAAALGATLLALYVGADAQHEPSLRPYPTADLVGLGNRVLGASVQLIVALAAVRHRRMRAAESELVDGLRRALRTTDDFVAVASHELKTPLTGARGYAQLLLLRARRGQFSGLDARSAQALTLIDDLLGRLNALMEDLLQVSRVRSGQLDLRPGRVDLAALARRVAEGLAPQAGRHAVAVVPASGERWAWADARRAEQVLINLIGNAIKYSPEGGRVEVVVSGGDGPHTPLLVRVSDEGIGVPVAERDRLFGRFARASNAAISPIPGTGLGLYLCRLLVEAQGGEIWLERSEEGRGSTFAFTLPAAPAGIADAGDRDRRARGEGAAVAPAGLPATRRGDSGPINGHDAPRASDTTPCIPDPDRRGHGAAVRLGR